MGSARCYFHLNSRYYFTKIGVVSFGYLLNEMGHTLSKMRQESEALEKDLQTIGKMSRYYNL